jgi:peptidoglycan/LPS O-acetylase OafA/YrhL
MNTTYFPNFHGFRFLAALAIVILHLFLMARRYGWLTTAPGEWSELLSLGVDFFFVLSGFLITGLIVDAKAKGALALRTFYLKRALRVFPLYFVVLAAVFVAAPRWGLPEIPEMPLGQDYGFQVTLHALLLPQVAKSFLAFVPYGGHLWTIGVEVMFYLIWPLFFVGSGSLRLIVAAVIGFLAVKLAALVTLGSGHPVSNFLAMSRFEILAMGGLGYIGLRYLSQTWSTKRPWLAAVADSAVSSRAMVLALLLLLAGLTVVTWIYFPPAVHLVAGGFFTVLLVCSVTGAIILPYLESRPVRYLGELSYGIYMWHFIAIGLFKGICDDFGFLPVAPSFWFWYVGLSLVFTVGMAALSYHLIEAPMNRLRRLL